MFKFVYGYKFFLIFAAAFFSALSGFLLKIGAVKIGEKSIFEFDVFSSYLVAMFSYGLGFIAYSLALRASSVSKVYPAMVGITVLLIFLWNIFSGFESVTIRGSVGTALVILGVFLVFSSAID